METETGGKNRISQFVDHLQSRGQYSFSRADLAAAAVGSPGAREAALRRLKKKGRIVSPRHGFHVIVPLEYRSSGCPPATWFIDQLMAYLGQPYYVGLLSAAELHGAAHQRPQVFQVMTDRATRPIHAGRVRIEFHASHGIHEMPVDRVRTDTGSMLVSTPEATALDLVRYPAACGHLDNVATVLVELAERIDQEKLAQVARKSRHPDAQRLGHLLDRLGLERITSPLAEVVASRRRRPVLLRPDRDAGGLIHDRRWYVIPNEEVNAELPGGEPVEP